MLEAEVCRLRMVVRQQAECIAELERELADRPPALLEEDVYPGDYEEWERKRRCISAQDQEKEKEGLNA